MTTHVVKIHYAKPLPTAIVVVGLLGAALNVMMGEWPALGVSVFLVAVGIGLLNGPSLVVTGERVEVKNPFQMTMRKVAIDGFGDLTIDGDVLRRASDHRRIRSLRFGGARIEDRVELERAIDAARARARV